MERTKVISKKDIKREWYLVDATGVRLGRLASFVAKLLQGKDKPIYSQNIDCGDNVIVINSKSIEVHPKKYASKMYWRHSGYIGSLKQDTLAEMLKKRPNEVIKKAVWGMIPKTKLGGRMIKKLYIYEGEDHKHSVNKPKIIKVT
ncbi:50S ribosomal protein L13 [Candidatus Dojkabacteria bacterium]|nr:50S ribosomal protein L13 [Candidatus Dojkabacteria bacterium]